MEESTGHGLELDLEGDGEKDSKDDAYIFSCGQFVPCSEIENKRKSSVKRTAGQRGK